MAKNKIEDLRNHLFAQLERLGEEDMKPEKLSNEVSRATAMAQIGNVIVNSAKAEMQFIKLTKSKGTGFVPDLKGLDQERNIRHFIEPPEKK